MVRLVPFFLLFILSGSLAVEQAQASLQTTGTVITVSAVGVVTHPNDEARATFMIEEQDRDMAVAASRVNQKMKHGIELIKQQDPRAILKTRSYYTYPVYPDDPIRPSQNSKARQPVGWRVGQYLDMKTANLQRLPEAVAAAQGVLGLAELHFGLAEATAKKLEEQRIAAAYRNLTERIAAIARAMNRNVSDAMLETVDFETSGMPVPRQDAYAAKSMRVSPVEAAAVEEPSFEPGETTLNMRVAGKVRFK